MNTNTSGEDRYDEETLKKVIALAGRLQTEHEDTMTAAQVEQIGAEVGVDPAFIRKALETIPSSAHPRKKVAKRAVGKATGKGVLRTRAEFVAWLSAFALPPLYTIAAFFIARPAGFMFGRVDGPPPDALTAIFAFIIVPLLLSPLPGFLTGRKRAGIVLGAWFALCLLFGLICLYGRSPGGSADFIGMTRADWDVLFEYAIPGMIMGVLGAWLRARIFPPSWLQEQQPSGINRQDLLNEFFALQKELESHKQHCAFLSVDVVGSTMMKQKTDELAVEYSFVEYQKWVCSIVDRNGGKMHSAAGDGIMAVFKDDVMALRAARELQMGIGSFNHRVNRLPQHFQIRCGIAAGEVAIADEDNIGALQSPVIDRAAKMQKAAQPGDIVISEELAGLANVEIGRMGPLSTLATGEQAYSWLAGQRQFSEGTQDVLHSQAG